MSCCNCSEGQPDGAQRQGPGGGSAAGQPWHEADGLHIDVRGLAPPQPLVAILRLIDTLDVDAAVIVHHDRDPQLLYPELAERGWSAEHMACAAGEVRLRLSKA